MTCMFAVEEGARGDPWRAAPYLFRDARHCAPERAPDLGNELADRLREDGFSVDRVLVEDLRPVPALCAMGRPQGG